MTAEVEQITAAEIKKLTSSMSSKFINNIWKSIPVIVVNIS